MKEEIDKIHSVARAKEIAVDFLKECGWQLEVNGEIISIPDGVELAVCSRAYIIEDLEGYTFGNHIFTTIIIGPEYHEFGTCVEYCNLGLYINLEGNLITTDVWRY